MWRRRWAPRATSALCLAVMVLLQLVAAGEGRRPPESGRGHARAHRARGLPPSTPWLPVHHDDAGGASYVGFNAAGSRCKSSRRATSGAAGRVAAGGGAACAEDDDDKRRIPTGANPLHNR
ncbi:unnamed protein product [Urochloa humidicola]